jgi:hypothetical protein
MWKEYAQTQKIQMRDIQHLHSWGRDTGTETQRATYRCYVVTVYGTNKQNHNNPDTQQHRQTNRSIGIDEDEDARRTQKHIRQINMKCDSETTEATNHQYVTIDKYIYREQTTIQPTNQPNTHTQWDRDIFGADISNKKYTIYKKKHKQTNKQTNRDNVRSRRRMSRKKGKKECRKKYIRRVEAKINSS